MKVLLALTAGYLVGARTGANDLGQLRRSLEALCGTEEFGEVVHALRAQVGGTLREIASVIDGEHSAGDAHGDLVTKVKQLVGT